MTKIIAITGTPGTGKTYIAKRLSLLLDYTYLNGSKLVKTAKLIEFTDKKRRTAVVDTSKFSNAVLKVSHNSSKTLIVDSHLSHFLPSKSVALCIVLSCNLKTLEKRLIKKRFNKSKIRENLDAEIFDTILTEATEEHHKIIKFDTTKITEKDIKNLANRIKKL